MRANYEFYLEVSSRQKYQIRLMDFIQFMDIWIIYMYTHEFKFFK